jgi:hypothetical protein
MRLYCPKNLKNLARQREKPRTVAQTSKAKIMKDSEKAKEQARKAEKAAEEARRYAIQAEKEAKKRK